MRSGRSCSASRLRLAVLTAMTLAFMAFGFAAVPASAATVQIAGDPLTIWIGDHGSFQERVKGNSDNSFYPRSNENGSAGFALAFPSGQVGAFSPLSSTVWGWASGNPNPDFNDRVFTSDSQGTVTGSGTEGSPYSLDTSYHVEVAGVDLLDIQQKTTYVNGSSTFVVQYHITNPQASDAVRFRALIGADLFLNSSDCGSGVFKAGPPRFIGGTSLGRTGGFTEEPTIPWTHYFEGQVQGGFITSCQTVPDQPVTVWGSLEGAADGPGFIGPGPGDTSSLTLDNGIGVQWDNKYDSPGLGPEESFDIQLNTLGTVPELKLTPSSQSVTAGAQAGLSATVTHGADTPAPGVSVRFSVAGANSGGGVATTDVNGQAGFSYKPSKAGTDTVTAFEDIDSDSLQGSAEPSASATVTVNAQASAPQSRDRTPPKLRIIVRRSIKLKAFLKRLVAAANCNEPASLRFELLGPAGVRAKRFTRNLGRKSLPIAGAGTRAVILKPKRKRLVRARKFKVQLRVTATDRAGNKTVATRTIRVLSR